MLNFWYQDAIIYEVDVKTFQDSNGDGIGDFVGLTRRIPYIAGLGATCLWLRPFHPSPLRDDGYDVTDYYAIDPRLGTFGDFVAFLREAREAGLRVIADLVVNHSSNEHPWFQASRSDPNSRYRDWYIWSDERPDDPVGPVFPGVQKDTWTYDKKAGAYYHHRFYEFQPDLNTANSEVREEIGKIITFWLELGLSGFRLDAVPFMLEHAKGTGDKVIPFPELDPGDPAGAYDLLRELRQTLSWTRGDAVFLAEANVSPQDAGEYFGPGSSRMHMLFNFIVNEHLMLALARQNAEPLERCLKELPKVPHGGRWVTFLRNHDEIDLSGLEDAERREVFAAFGPEPRMQAYGRGIRRRLAPMLGGDHRRISLAHSLLLSLPGTPMIRHGEEIGMGDDLSLPERLSVRTPMQWSGEKNAGFSTAPAKQLIRPVITGGEYGYEQVNVGRQSHDPESLMNRFERLVRARKNNPEFARGQAELLETGDDAVFVHRSRWRDGVVIACHNLADRPARVSLSSALSGARLIDLIDRKDDESIDPARIELPPYGYRWFRARK